MRAGLGGAGTASLAGEACCYPLSGCGPTARAFAHQLGRKAGPKLLMAKSSTERGSGRR